MLGTMWIMATLICCRQEFRLESDLHSNLSITIYLKRAHQAYYVTPHSGRSGKLTSPLGLGVAQYKILCIRKRWVEILLLACRTIIGLKGVQLDKSQDFYLMHSSLLFVD